VIADCTRLLCHFEHVCVCVHVCVHVYVCRSWQVDLRVENEHYLRDHPELSTLVNSFMEGVLEARPTNPIQFAVDFFSGFSLISCVNFSTACIYLIVDI
jgi:hypothetical protein